MNLDSHMNIELVTKNGWSQHVWHVVSRRPDLWKCKTRSETIRNPVMFEENQTWFLTIALFPYWDLRWFKMDIIKVVVIFIWKPMVKRGSPTLRHTPMGMGQKLLEPQMWLEMGWWSPLKILGFGIWLFCTKGCHLIMWASWPLCADNQQSSMPCPCGVTARPKPFTFDVSDFTKLIATPLCLTLAMSNSSNTIS